MNYFNLPVITVNDTVYTLGFFINILVILTIVLIIIPIIKEIFKQRDKEEYHWETASMYDESLFVDGNYLTINGNVDMTPYYIDTEYNPVTSIEINPNVKINLSSPKESYPTICKQCGSTFKLAYDGTGKCPYCDTYYSPMEIK